MEKFKAVEKAMKTKAYSEEGLSAAAKLDPKEQVKVEASEFLSAMVDELEQQIETLEAESEGIQATMKKGKSQAAKTGRVAEIDRVIERHKWHQGKLELIRRSLENGGVEAEQVTDLEESIRYYVSDGVNDDFMEDEEMYDDLELEDDEGVFGMGQEGAGSSQDNQSVNDEPVEMEPPAIIPPPPKIRKATKDADVANPTRKASALTKSPLPALATLHTPLLAAASAVSSNASMKPAPVPTRPPGEGLKYASAAAAAAASDKNNVGIAPLPPPPGLVSAANSSPLASKASVASSPAPTPAHMAQVTPPAQPTPVIEKSAPVAAAVAAVASAVASMVEEPIAPAPKTSKRGKAVAKPTPIEAPEPKGTSHIHLVPKYAHV